MINQVDKCKLSCYTQHRRSTTVSLETCPLYSFEGNRVFLNGRLPWEFFLQLGNLAEQNRSAVLHAINQINKSLFKNGDNSRGDDNKGAKKI